MTKWCRILWRLFIYNKTCLMYKTLLKQFLDKPQPVSLKNLQGVKFIWKRRQYDFNLVYDVMTSFGLHVTCWVLAGICWWSVLLLFGVVVCLLVVIYKMGIFCIMVVYLCIQLDVLRAVFSLILGGLCVGCAMLRGFSGLLFRLCIFCCIHCKL